MKIEFTFGEGALQGLGKLAPKNPAQYFDGQEERGTGLDSAGVIRGQTSCGQYAMHVGMMLKFLIPGMQNAEETDLGTQMLGVAGHFEQGFSAGLK